MNPTLPNPVFKDALLVLEGVVSGLQRTSHVSGGSGNSSARTTHICLFSMGAHRVELKLPSVAPIAEGDRVRLAGSIEPGLFSAIACRNLTTGWVSSAAGHGCAIAFAIFFACFGLIFAGIAFTFAVGASAIGPRGIGIFAIVPILMGLGALGGTGFAAYSILRASGRAKRAHEMIA